MTLAKLPPLPRKPKPGQADIDRAVNAAPSADLVTLRKRCLESAIGRPDDDGHVHAICAICSEPTPWWQTVWGKWNSGHTTVITIPPRKGDTRWKRITIAVYVSGRTCVDCSMEATDWRRVAEPAVTVEKNAILSGGAGGFESSAEVKEVAEREEREAAEAEIAAREARKAAREAKERK